MTDSAIILGNDWTHGEGVDAARLWLADCKGFPVVLTEIKTTTSETPDVIGWRWRGPDSGVIEVKVSRSDFLRDTRKPCHRCGQLMGRWRWYLAPLGMIEVSELPAEHGLLEYDGRRVRETWPAPERLPEDVDLRGELQVLLSVVRRCDWPNAKTHAIRSYTIDGVSRATICVQGEGEDA